MAQASGGKKAAYVIGEVAFFVGFVVSILGGIFFRDNGGAVLALVILGITVSVLNISAREVVPVLVAAIALIVTANVNAFAPLDKIWSGLGLALDGMVTYLAVFMIPVAVISAVRAVLAVARPD